MLNHPRGAEGGRTDTAGDCGGAQRARYRHGARGQWYAQSIANVLARAQGDGLMSTSLQQQRNSGPRRTSPLGQSQTHAPHTHLGQLIQVDRRPELGGIVERQSQAPWRPVD
jgi:hypothetical protein